MIIVSQDRDLIINFDNVTVIGIAQNRVCIKQLCNATWFIILYISVNILCY